MNSLAANAASSRLYSNTISTPSCLHSKSPATTTFVKLLKLTEDERSLLLKHNGCLKCRQFYMDHTSKTCPNNFPIASTYQTLTLANAKNAQCSLSSTRPTSAQASKPSTPCRHVTTVLPMTEDWQGLAEETPQSDTDEYVHHKNLSPLSTPSLLWRCSIPSSISSAPFLMTALIDDGSQFILI
ncbi:hypothetical protein EW146_g8826 [Bondarzewia mesenterica]|uniref:Uncharacterized protein n=1 Tax=Bondarzewia mesenterica TaxID=1095465 RepID=A0A4S4LCS3_9AGAM|nr:hypothetical protein EW146_g8826 [Bondarzewia mesenterica]